MMQVRFIGAIKHTVNTPHPVRAGEVAVFGGERSYTIEWVVWDFSAVGSPAQVAHVSLTEAKS